MKKPLYLVVFFSLVLCFMSLFSITPVFAQTENGPELTAEQDKAIPNFLPNVSPKPFLGQSHFYSYVFRGNGEAVVTVKVVLSNTSESETLKETTLRFPNIDPKELVAYQILGTGQCVRYDTPGFDQGRGGYYPPTCSEYGEPDYYGYYGTAKYQKAEVDYKGDTLTVKLPKVIGPQKSGAFFVYFRSFSIADRQAFGSFKYNIETLKVDDQINQLTIGIDTDSDLFLKGAKGEVNYRQAADVSMLKAAPATGEAMTSPAIDSFLGNIGYGTISKNASNLAPLESYKVSGMYAKSKLGLYAKETALVLGLLLGVILLIVIIIRKVFRLLKSNDKMGERDTKEPESKKTVSTGNNTTLFFASLGLSFVASVTMALYTIALIFVGGYLNNFGYSYQPFMILFMVIISFCIYSFILFAPGIFWGYKKGMGWGIGQVIMTIFWLFIFLGVTVGVLFLTDANGGVPVFSPMESVRKF